MSHEESSEPKLLRQRAEARLEGAVGHDGRDRTEAETQRLVHELQVHQIELELQNEDLKQSRAEAEMALAQYTELYEFSPVGYFTFDRAGVILQTNVAGARMLGPDRALLAGQRFRRFLTAAELTRFENLLQRVFATRRHQSAELEVVGQRPTPYTVLMEAIVSPDGQTCLASVVDISDRKALEQAQATAALLDVKRQVAEAASLSKSLFLSRMSHELRTPLNAMLGFTQLLQMDQRRPLDEQQRTRTQAVMQAGWHLLRLIDDVLDLPAVEAGAVGVSLVPLDVRAVLDEAILLAAPMLQAQGVTLSVESVPVDAQHSPFALADRTRLVQVVSNLLSNAIKYNKVGGSVRVVIDAGQTNSISIAVIDTGYGLSSDQLGRIFQPFNRLGQEQSGIPGTGLGLVIAKRLLELMGGDLTVHSEIGQGSRFEVRLVRAAEPAEPAQAEPLAPEMDMAQVGEVQAFDVLYIEDNEAHAKLMSEVVSLRPGCTLHVATNLADAEVVAEHLRPRLVLVDLNLPDAAGVGLLQRLRQFTGLQDAKIIVVSADASATHGAAAISAGAHGYMSKPIKVSDVLVALDRCATA